MQSGDFVQKLLAETEAVYLKTSLFKEIGTNPFHSPYSIGTLPLKKGQPLVLNLCCPESASEHDPLTHIPLVHYSSLLKKFLGSDLGTLANFSQLCFFRVPPGYRLSEQDRALWQPLFRKYLMHLQPSEILITGTETYETFREVVGPSFAYTEVRQVSLRDGNGIHNGFTGCLKGITLSPITVVALPLAEYSMEEETVLRMFRLVFNRHEETDSVPPGAERIFEAGIEGGIEAYYRFRRKKDDYLYFKKEINLRFSDEGQEDFQSATYQLGYWEDCWQSFSSLAERMESWLMAYPVYIHPDYVSFIQSSILSERHRLHQLSSSMHLDDWLEKLREARYNEQP